MQDEKFEPAFFVAYMRNYGITTANCESLHNEKKGFSLIEKT